MPAERADDDDEQNNKGDESIKVIFLHNEPYRRKCYPYNRCGDQQNDARLYNGTPPKIKYPVQYPGDGLYKIGHAFKLAVVYRVMTVTPQIHNTADKNNSHRNEYAYTQHPSYNHLHILILKLLPHCHQLNQAKITAYNVAVQL